MRKKIFSSLRLFALSLVPSYRLEDCTQWVARIGISGIVLFLVGMTMTSQRSMTPEEIEHWQPSAEKMPDAGRVMFRVDVTLDEPIRSTILCGPCGHVTAVDGPKPVAFQCPKCEKTLWDEEE